jgi:phosphoribosylanthranilate isomerase
VSAVRVKICGITRLQDLESAVEAGADALGFVFARRSPRMLDAAVAELLVERVPAFVARVGLFMDQDFEEVARLLDRLPLNVLQFHGGEDAAYCRQFGLPYVKAVSMADPESLPRAEREYTDAAGLLLDSHGVGETGGTGRIFEWARIPPGRSGLILAGGLTPDNVAEAVRQVRPWAVDVSSGVEDAPGVKNGEKMRNFIREAKREY